MSRSAASLSATAARRLVYASALASWLIRMRSAIAVPSSIRITVDCVPAIPRASSMIATSDSAPLAAITVMLVSTGRTIVTGSRIPMRSRSCGTSRNTQASAGGATT